MLLTTKKPTAAPRHARRKNRQPNRWISVLTGVSILVLWFCVTQFGNVNALIVPSPQAVWNSLLEILADGYKGYSLWQHIADSLWRLFLAYVAAIVTAVPLGLASGYFPKLRAALDPIIAFYRPLPPLAYYTVLVLWMGIGNGSKVMLLFLAGFAPIYISCTDGVTRIREDYIHGAQMLGANRKQVFFHVIFPAALPDLFTGLRNAMSSEYASLVAAEMVAAVTGIGWLVLDASKYMRSDIVFLGIILMGIMGILLDAFLKFLEKKIVFWKGK